MRSAIPNRPTIPSRWTALGGTIVGSGLVPVGTADFSSYLIQVKEAQPDVLCLLLAGDDQINAMKQITQFGINKSIAVGGALFELEQIAALPQEARYGIWDVRMVLEPARRAAMWRIS